MPTLRPEVKKKWTEALRSGKYDQGVGQLRDKHDNYCCLGVLCQVAAEEGVIPPAKVQVGSPDYFYGGEGDDRSGVLPLAVQEWAYEDDLVDLSKDNRYGFEDPMLGDYHASNWNDDHKADFKKIALLVEEYL